MSENNSHHIVTAATQNIWHDHMIPWIGSFRTFADQQQELCVLDYGLSNAQRQKALSVGVKVHNPVRRYETIVVDRFISIAAMAKQHPGIYAHWDADCFFLESVQPLFDEYCAGKLMCCIDHGPEGPILPPFKPGYTRKGNDFDLRILIPRDQYSYYSNILDGLTKRYGQLLQAGFIMGDAEAWEAYVSCQQKCIDTNIIPPIFWADMVALAVFAHEYPDKIQQVDVTWNCIPDWKPMVRGDRKLELAENSEGTMYKKSLQHGNTVKVFHLTGPYRNTGSQYASSSLFPNEYSQWTKEFSA